MHTLHFVRKAGFEEDRVRAVKALRAALVALKGAGTLTGSMLTYAAAENTRYGLVGEHDDLGRVQDAALELETISQGRLQAFIDASDDELAAFVAGDLTPEQTFSALQPGPSGYRTVSDAPQGQTPTKVTEGGYRRVIVLMQATEGDPARTLEAIMTMKANTESTEWDEALVALRSVYPWVENVAKQLGMWPDA